MNHIQLVGCASPLLDNLLETWRDGFSVVEHTPLGSLDAASERIRDRRPQWIVYCGETASSWETGASVSADEPTRVERIARAGLEVDARVLVLSSDAVFAGPKLFHEESEAVASDADSQYLRAVEQAALAVQPAERVLVVRTHAFGWSANGASFVERVWQALGQSESLEVDGSSYATPILASDLAEILLRCFRARLHGLLHVAGAERTSPFRFAEELANVAGFDRGLIRAQPMDAMEGDLPLAQRETSLASRLVRRELGVALPLLRESLARFVEQATNGHRDRIRGVAQESLIRAA